MDGRTATRSTVPFFFCTFAITWGLQAPLLLAGNELATLPLLMPLFFGGSVVFSWLYNRTPAGLWMVVTAHIGAHLNNSHIAVPHDLTPVVVHTIAYCLAAIALVLGDRERWPPPGLARAG